MAGAGASTAMEIMDGGKPQCGGNQPIGEYDVGIHVLGLCKLNTAVAECQDDLR